jgi:lipoprotein-anchoring transpeptidase ErfK/SrfK
VNEAERRLARLLHDNVGQPPELLTGAQIMAATATVRRRRWVRLAVPALAAAAVIAIVVGVVLANGPRAKTNGVGVPAGPLTSTSAPAASSSASPSSSSSAPGSPVHVSLLEADRGTYGVGMPIVAYFSQNITDSSAFIKATTVTVNGSDAAGSWYFEATGDPTKPMAAHYRPQNYWPADSTINLKLPVQGLSAGKDLAFDNSLTLSMNIGDAHVSTVDCAAERMTVTSNGAPAFPAAFPTSCGASKTPTASGTKVVMQLGEDAPGTNALRPNGAVRMVGGGGALGNYDLLVNWSVRITTGGEYVHAAPWNGNNIGARSTSDGCTNLSTANAQAFYAFSHIGDVVTYVNTGGPAMRADDGFGDWNVAWPTWQTGGALAVSN